MNVILGSGIVGLLAKIILGKDWKVIPFYKSRFFSYNPALDDNFIIRDERIEEFINELNKQLNNILKTKYFMYKKGYSMGGEIVKQHDKEIRYAWLYKIFGNEIPPQSEAYLDNKLGFFVYDLRVNQLYERLMSLYLDELKANAAEGQLSEIGDHYYVINGKKYAFDKMVSTIPLNALLTLRGQKLNLSSKTIHYIHLETDSLNFEGCNQLLVVDPIIDFYKVTNIAPNRYLFYCHNEISNPGSYLMNFMHNFEIIDGTSIADVIPCGSTPKLDQLENSDIFCVGSSAQWDWCMDISSCVLRLLKYAGRDKNPQKQNVINYPS